MGAVLTTKTFEIGVGAWALGREGSGASFADQAAFAESLGFHSFWLPENHFGDVSSLPAPLLLLAAASAKTCRIRLGTGSYLLPIRHPVQMAEEVAVLDRLSEGRVILGVGRGYHGGMFAAFDTPSRDKRRRFEEALERMISAWKGEAVAYDPGTGPEKAGAGDPIYLAPSPVQKPHPPVWVAAFGPKALEQAGRLGLPYLASPIEALSTLEENFARHREAAEEGGQTYPDAVPVMRTIFVSNDARKLAAIRDGLQAQASSLAKSPMPAIRRGVGRAVDDWAIVGEPEAVREQIERYRERLGVTHFIASRSRLPSVTPAEMQASLELLAAAMG